MRGVCRTAGVRWVGVVEVKKPCLEPRCGNFASYRGRCSLHAKQNDKSMHRAGRALYSTKRWQILRRHKLGLSPICETEGCNELATDVHHKHGVEADPWSLEGLEALCHSHHSSLTRATQIERTA